MFIELHGEESGKRFLIRPESIVQLHEAGTKIFFPDGTSEIAKGCTVYTNRCRVSVVESYEDIKGAITGP